MRAVRCDACGAKAMVAAAKCPTCGHLFELRDGFGELLPLAYCSGCESYYPEKTGECRWCGTKPERAPIGPRIWRGVAAVALAAVVGTIWIVRNRAPEDTGPTRMKPASQSASATLAQDTVAAQTTAAASDSSPAPTTIARTDTIGPNGTV